MAVSSIVTQSSIYSQAVKCLWSCGAHSRKMPKCIWQNAALKSPRLESSINVILSGFEKFRWNEENQWLILTPAHLTQGSVPLKPSWIMDMLHQLRSALSWPDYYYSWWLSKILRFGIIHSTSTFKNLNSS